MDKVKQVIVIRKDLNMRKGKIASQAAHAAMCFLSRRFIFTFEFRTNWVEAILYPPEVEWLKGSFTKIACYVNSLEELEDLHDKAKEAGLEAHIMVDNGDTEFGGVATATALAIGPDYSSKIDPITKGLPLL